MSFPTNPTNGQQANVNGVVYTYNSSKGVWSVTTTFSGNALVDQINANAVVSAGNVSGTNFNGATVTTTGNVAGGNLSTGGTITSTGNITGGNLVTAGQVSATGNITGGNLVTAGQVSATSTITGGNLSTGGTVTATGNVSGGNLSTGGTLSITGTSSFGGNITASHVNPSGNGTVDLGSTTARWRNLYTSDLNLNNGVGDYTIVEGEEDLFLYNNKRGKVYKFALIEVDPEQATPKIDKLNSKS